MPIPSSTGFLRLPRPRLAALARNIADFERRASKRLPGPIWHFLQGGADDEWSLARNSDAFDEIRLIPDILVDVSRIDTSAYILGRKFPLPLVLAPTGMSLLFHREGEMAVACAAASAGVLYGLSTMATTTIEAVAEANGPRMLQLYCFRDRGLTLELLNRARASGYEALCLTADTPVAGNRERDLLTGMTLPPRFSIRSLSDFARHPRWVLPKLFGRHFDLCNITKYAPSVRAKRFAVIDYVNSQMDRSVSWKDLEWLRDRWEGSLLIKGVSSPQDAKQAVDLGCEGLMISNHGGRQLDGVAAPIEQLPAIRDRIGTRTSVILDGGIRRGTHILKAIALGATACSIGRPYLFGLAADGERGVSRVISILREELERGMALMGCPSLSSISARHVRIAQRFSMDSAPESAPGPSQLHGAIA
jgi:L-lactate dehydrogenase (cytochrome)